MVYLSKSQDEFIQMMNDLRDGNIDLEELKIDLASQYDVELDDESECEQKRCATMKNM